MFWKVSENLYGVPEKTKSEKSSALISKNYRELLRNTKIKVEFSPLRLHNGTGVERAFQTLRSPMFAILDGLRGFIESINPASKVLRFTIHTGLKVTPLELHRGRKPRTKLSNLVKVNKSYLSIGQNETFQCHRKRS